MGFFVGKTAALAKGASHLSGGTPYPIVATWLRRQDVSDKRTGFLEFGCPQVPVTLAWTYKFVSGRFIEAIKRETGSVAAAPNCLIPSTVTRRTGLAQKYGPISKLAIVNSRNYYNDIGYTLT